MRAETCSDNKVRLHLIHVVYRRYIYPTKSDRQEKYRAAGGCARHLLFAGFLLGRFSVLKMEVISFYETSAHVQISRRYIPEDGNITTAVRTATPKILI
jgi:CRISPR/Cas system-associated protein endoribonuclease Cas2